METFSLLAKKFLFYVDLVDILLRDRRVSTFLKLKSYIKINFKKFLYFEINKPFSW